MNKKETDFVEFVSPVRTFFEENSDCEVGQLIVANSADSFRSSIDRYNEKIADNSNLKHTILLLDHSIETLLKGFLANQEKQAILVGKHRSRLQKTLDFRELLKEIERRGVVLDRNLHEALCHLHNVRNDIWHFGFLGVKAPLDQLISFCCCVYWLFMFQHMPQWGIRSMLSEQQFSTLMGFEDRWHLIKSATAKSMFEWQSSLSVEQDQYIVRPCKECLNLSAVIDTYADRVRCRCCGYECSPAEYPEVSH